MTVGQLIDELNKYPKNMPVAVFHEISFSDKDDPNWIRVSESIWNHANYPYNMPGFKYVNLE